MIASLNRINSNEIQTHAHWYFYEGYEQVFHCIILELPDRQNKRNISRILPGKYSVVKRWSEKYKWHFHISDSNGRKLVLVHQGNYFRDTRGCQLPGTSFKDIDNDGNLDVIWSRRTLDNMLAIAPDKFDLYINDNDK